MVLAHPFSFANSPTFREQENTPFLNSSIRCNLSMFEGNLWETWLNSWLNMKHCVFVCRPSDTVPSPSPLHAIGCIVPEIVSQTQPKPGGCMGKPQDWGQFVGSLWIIHIAVCPPGHHLLYEPRTLRELVSLDHPPWQIGVRDLA